MQATIYIKFYLGQTRAHLEKNHSAVYRPIFPINECACLGLCIFKC